MPYYRGDGNYYRGDGYYRGDPLFGAIIGAVARKVGLGKLAAKAGRWVAGRITGQSVKRAAQVAAATVGGAIGTAVVSRALPSAPVIQELEELPPMEMNGGAVAGGGGGTQWVVTPSGRRMRVRWSSTKGRWVAVRAMNPLNPKALNRAIRRATGFEKFAKKTVNALYRTSSGTTKTRKFKRK